MLNEFADEIIAVRGNGDSYDIESLLDFKLEDIINLEINGMIITMTHGHLYRKSNLPPDCGKLFLQGHSHCAEILKLEDKIIANPGSISKPRNGAEPTYIVFDEKEIQIKNLQGKTLEQLLFT